MNKAQAVLLMLIPNGGYTQVGDTYEGIDFVECEPITKAQYKAGFDKVDAWQAEREQAKVAAKEAAQAKLAALGLTVQDLQALGL